MSIISIPQGKYVLGDPCYCVPDQDWSDFLHLLKDEGRCAWKGGQSVAFSTAYGDGVYEGWHEYTGRRIELGVDAGMIGVVPLALAEFDPNLSVVVEFDKTVECWSDGKNLHFGDWVVATGDIEDEVIW